VSRRSKRYWSSTSTWSVLPPLLVVLVLVGTACGTTETPAAPPAPPSTPATAPPTTRDEKADQQVARDALLEVDDLPGSDWTETKRTLSSEAEPSTADNPLDTCPKAKQLAADLGLDRAAKAMSAKSSKFTLGTQSAPSAQVEETVEIRAHEDEATSMANVFGDDAMLQCLKDELKATLANSSSKSVTVDAAKIKVERSKVGKLGDDHAVFLITVPAQASGITINVTFVAAFVRVGRGYVNLSYGTYSGVDVDKEVVPVLTKAAAKLKKALQS
jgi:hypothetical protein